MPKELKFALIGEYANKKALFDAKLNLERLGYTVTSRWVLPNEEEDALEESGAILDRSGLCCELSANNTTDIDKANIVICFLGPRTRGGYNFELGYATAKNKRIYLIGKRLNVFHFHKPFFMANDVLHVVNHAEKYVNETEL